MAGMGLSPRITQVGRRQFVIGVVAGGAWGAFAAILSLLAATWMDLLWELSSAARLACGIGALSLALGLAVATVCLVRRHAAPRLVARKLDKAGQTEGEILTGVDLFLESTSTGAISLGLTELAIERAWRLADAVPANLAASLRPAARAVGGLVMLAILVAGLAICFPRLFEVEYLRFFEPFGDHPPFSRVIYHVEPGDVRVVYGQGFQVNVTTEGAVDRLDLVLENAAARAIDTFPLFPGESNVWNGSLATVTTSGRYFVRSASGRSAKYRIDVITVPRLEKVHFRITPPAYTQAAAYEGAVPQGGIAGLPGTQVQVRVQSNRPLSGGEIRFEGAKQGVTALTAAAQEATGTFELREPGKIKIHVRDVDGQTSTDAFSTAVTLLTDERPMIRLAEPPAMSFATPNGTIPVTLLAEDDYGISRVQLFRSLNDSRALAADAAVPVPPKPRLSERVLLPLAAYQLSAGDEIKLFGRVEDNDPAGPNGTESAIAIVRIISQADFEKLVRAERGMEMFLTKYRQAQRRAEKLADDIDRLQKKAKSKPKDSKEEQEMRTELNSLADRLRAEADAILESTKHLLPYDLDKELARHLEQMGRRLERLSDDSRRMAKSNMSRDEMEHALRKMLKELADERESLDQEAIRPLEHLADILPLLEDAARFVILYERQKALAERLESLKGKDNPTETAVKNRMRDLQAEQHRLRQDLDRLLDDIEDHAKRLPEDPKLDDFRKESEEFARKVRASGAGSRMSEAETALGELSGTAAYKAAKEAADILEKFVNMNENEGGMQQRGEMCLRFQPSLAKGLGNTVAQLLSDMGLRPGGQGSGMSQPGSQNVGLYGDLPALGQIEHGKMDDRSRAMGEGSAKAPTSAAQRGQANPQPVAPEQAGSGVVPFSYRRRVAEYFQRIAEETGRR